MGHMGFEDWLLILGLSGMIAAVLLWVYAINERN